MKQLEFPTCTVVAPSTASLWLSTLATLAASASGFSLEDVSLALLLLVLFLAPFAFPSQCQHHLSGAETGKLTGNLAAPAVDIRSS